MNTKIGFLSGLLAVQALVVAVLLLSSGMGAGEDAGGLLPFEPTSAAKFSIAAGDEEVALSRADEGWQLDDGLPADDGKVGEVLEKLAKVTTAWPVATSTATAERFEVTQDNFQRRLVIESEDGETATLYLGSSPGYRRVHARAEGADEVYSIDFSNYEAPTDSGQWLDKKLLRPQGDVAALGRHDGWSLERGDGDGDSDGDGEWRVDGAPAEQEAADKLVGRFEDLSVLGIVAEEGEPKGSFTVRDEGGEYRLDFYFQEEADDYSVTSSRFQGRFEVATYIAEQMLIGVQDLLPGEEAPEAAEEVVDDAVPGDQGEASESAP